MYDYLEGAVALRGLGRLVLDVGGVGYELSVPFSAPFPAQGRVRVFVHLTVREDSHTLYAFPTREMRELFRLLLTVRGVGPTMALALLSSMEATALVRVILAEDLEALTRVRGVGKKTAAQILLDLKNKGAELAALAPREDGLPQVELVPEPRLARERNIADAVTALVSVGYSDKEAKKQVEAAVAKIGPQSLEELVRVALQS